MYLYKLTREDCYYKVSEITGIAESTAINILDELYNFQVNACHIIVETWHDIVEKYFSKPNKGFLVKIQSE